MHESKPASPSRRRFLIASAAVAAVGSAGVVWIGVGLKGKEAWIETTIRKHLPGIQLDPQSLTRFVQSFAIGRNFNSRQQQVAVWVDQTMPGIARQIPKVSRLIERLERLVVSEYLIGSNFFRIPDPRRETVFYIGNFPACGNPFAVFQQ